MTKKRIAVVFTALFLLLSLFPLLGMPFFRGVAPSANERLSARPSLMTRAGTLNERVLNDLSDYFADHFALRAYAATAWARLNAVLGSSAEEQVVLGTEGWLYYSETLDDYRGFGLTDGELRDLARDLTLAQEFLNAQGKDFVFVVAPNKNSLYPQAMPARIRAAHEQSNAARLLPMLERAQLNSVDLFAAFADQTDTLYYRTDSHWTDRGAALAADRILAALGRESACFQMDFTQPALHRGDLCEMLYPAGRDEEPELVHTQELLYTCLGDPRGGEAITIRTESPASGVLFCWRDSFGNALYPYLAAGWGSAVFSRSSSYDLTREELRGADAVVLEIVERNLGRLWETPALFPAPQREIAPPSSAAKTLPFTFDALDGGALARVCVQIPETLREGGTPAYLAADGAFYEACVHAGPEDGTVLLTACLPAGARPDGAAILSGGSLTLYQLEETQS